MSENKKKSNIQIQTDTAELNNLPEKRARFSIESNNNITPDYSYMTGKGKDKDKDKK